MTRGPRPLGVWLLAAGIVMTLGFAPFGWWPLSVASLAFLWWCVVRSSGPKQAALASLVWGMGHGVSALYWLPWAFFKDADGSLAAAVFGGVPSVLGLALYGALGTMLAAALARMALGRWGRWRAGAVWVAVLVAVEFVKGLSPYGFPWLPVGAVWGEDPVMMQAASVGGVWLLSAIVLVCALLLEGLAVAWRQRQGMRRQAAALLVVLGGVALFGMVRLHGAPVVGVGDGPLLRLVQPDIQSPLKWDDAQRWAFLGRTLATAFDSGTPTPPTVVMPETAVAFYLDDEPVALDVLATRMRAAMPADGAVVTGTVRRSPDPDADPHVPPALTDHYYNSLRVVDTAGRIVDTYDKRFLVPFGEYIPLRGLLDALPLPAPIRTLSQSRLDFTHGTHSPQLRTPAGIAVGLICYEGIFPLPVLRAAHGARYLVNVTNDSWFTGTIALYQHATLARLRAVETGLPLVRVANTGLTVVYDGYGRVAAQLPINTPAYADVRLPPMAPRTLLDRIFGG